MKDREQESDTGKKSKGMHFSIITAFPEFFNDFLSTSIIGRAVKAGLVRVDLVDLRPFGRGGYRQIDDYAFGSGGMVLMAEPLSEALQTARAAGGGEERDFVVYPTPQGTLLTQDIVDTLACQEHVILVCGHYEGLDERFTERMVDLEVTIGDCVLTGGEIPAMAIIDAVSRLIPGVVGKSEAVENDSFYRGMLDCPHYTRPASWEGIEAPEVLLSGNTAAVEEWRRRQAVARTVSRRPDLLARSGMKEYVRGVYLAFTAETADDCEVEILRNLEAFGDSYGVARVFLIVPKPDARESFREVLKEGRFGRIRLMPSLKHATDWIAKKEGPPLVTEVCDVVKSGARHWLELKRLFVEKGEPVLFCLSLKNGDEYRWEQKKNGVCCGFSMLPLQEGLSFCGKAAVLCDRFLGSR